MILQATLMHFRTCLLIFLKLHLSVRVSVCINIALYINAQVFSIKLCTVWGFFVNTAIFHRHYFIFEQGLADNKGDIRGCY